MSTKEQNDELARLVKVFEDALSAAEAYAAEHDLTFGIDPSYGMGGYFAKVEESWQADHTGEDIGHHAWFASSQSC